MEKITPYQAYKIQVRNYLRVAEENLRAAAGEAVFNIWQTADKIYMELAQERDVRLHALIAFGRNYDDCPPLGDDGNIGETFLRAVARKVPREKQKTLSDLLDGLAEGRGMVLGAELDLESARKLLEMHGGLDAEIYFHVRFMARGLRKDPA